MNVFIWHCGFLALPVFQDFSIFVAVLGLRCGVGFPLVSVTRGSPPVAVRGHLIAVVSLIVEHRL